MPDLRIKPNKDNGDLPKKFDGHGVEKLHKVIDRKIKILEDSNKLQDEFRLQLRDIFNPTLLREKLEKDNGQK
mgnify:FL=1|jgi:hypothetical protein